MSQDKICSDSVTPPSVQESAQEAVEASTQEFAPSSDSSSGLSAGLEHALAKCHAQGMRISRQRRYILELLWSTHEHLTAKEIYDRLSHAGYEIGHTSVYQNLDALSSQEIIECVERADGRLYGSLSDPHSHVICLDTQQITDIQLELPPEFIRKVEQQTGMAIVSYRINFFGHRVDS